MSYANIGQMIQKDECNLEAARTAVYRVGPWGHTYFRLGFMQSISQWAFSSYVLFDVRCHR